MIKAVIFDIDNTLYSYDENHIYGMEALAVYCRDSFGITTDEMQACYRKAGRIMTDRIGTDTAAIHSRMLRMQCMLELLEQPLFPHARNIFRIFIVFPCHLIPPFDALRNRIRKLIFQGSYAECEPVGYQQLYNRLPFHSDG